MKFKYSEYKCTDGTKIYRPTVPIIFKYKSSFIQTEAVVDSGADFTILPIEVAGILGIKLDQKAKTIFHGAGNNSFTVYPSLVKIEHMLRQGGFRAINWQTEVFFAESQPGILLGHQGFLEKFKVTLESKRKELEICL